MLEEMSQEIVCITYFLQEICYTFSMGAFKTHEFKELKNMLTRTLIDDHAIWEKNNVVEEIESLWCRLQERN